MKPWYLRLFLRVFATLFYRLDILRADRLPATGGTLLVSNHISTVDVLLILASTRRAVRFLVPVHVCAIRWLRPWVKLLRFIPLPEEQRPQELAEALR